MRLADDIEQLCEVDGRIVTWWDLINESEPKPTFVDLATVLRQLHDLPGGSAVALCLDSIRCHVCGAGWKQSAIRCPVLIEPSSQPAPLSYAPSTSACRLIIRRAQSMVTRTSATSCAARMGRLSSSISKPSRGGRESGDASVFGAACAAFGWMNHVEDRRCVAAYGWDPLTWSGFTTLRQIRELKRAAVAISSRRAQGQPDRRPTRKPGKSGLHARRRPGRDESAPRGDHHR